MVEAAHGTRLAEAAGGLMGALTIFGLLSVSAMLPFQALEQRSRQIAGRLAAQPRPRGRWARAQAAVTSRGGTSMRLIGVSSPDAETMAVSSLRQRGHTKRTSCGVADQLERFRFAAIGQASQCEHDTRNRPGSSIPIP
jgi:hypothetical protein